MFIKKVILFFFAVSIVSVSQPVSQEDFEVYKTKLSIHKFYAGEKAKAEQVNNNFDSLVSQLMQLNNKIKSLTEMIDSSSLKKNITVFQATSPIGTIIASMLTPKQMTKLTNGTWVIADGSTGTRKYQKVTGKTNLPDLRGNFIRGLKPGDGRYPGHFQSDLFKRHNHRGYDYHWVSYNKGEAISTTKREPFYSIQDTLTGNTGGSETRPKNVALNFYIKVK